MIATPFYIGQGLGNQLANYVTVRTLALDKGLDFGVQYPENFKGKDFLNLEMGLPVVGGLTPVEGKPPAVLPDGFTTYYHEEMIGNGDYDPGILAVTDGTLIHGNLQGENYFKHRKEEIREWLKVNPAAVNQLEMTDDMCVINFRGGEYKYVPDFFLPQSYWDNAVELMRARGVTRFFVVTDDVQEAQRFFPNFQVTHEIANDFYSVSVAKNIILSNSSFGWFPAWLNDEAYIIAPKFWGRHNREYWFLTQNYTEKFEYII